MEPISKTDELPILVKSLPSAGREMWRIIYNRVSKRMPTQQAKREAWTVVKQFYKKNKKGKWQRRSP